MTETPDGFTLVGTYYTRTVSASRDNTIRNGNDLDLVYTERVEKDLGSNFDFQLIFLARFLTNNIDD